MRYHKVVHGWQIALVSATVIKLTKCFIKNYKRLLCPKSLYRSRAGRHFYGTENVIWDGFGPIGNNEKKNLVAHLFLRLAQRE